MDDLTPGHEYKFRVKAVNRWVLRENDGYCIELYRWEKTALLLHIAVRYTV